MKSCRLQTSHLSHSLQETISIGKRLAEQLQVGDIISLEGMLGVGKTALIKAIVSHLHGIDPSEITSPTFAFLHIYEGNPIIYHFDLYRLKTPLEFLERGFDDYFYQGICLIEWGDQIHSLLPKDVLHIAMQYTSQHARKIQIHL